MEPVKAFADQKYLSLETYKKNGRPVRTVVWFVMENGIIYFHTSKKTWKYKRIMRNPAVKIAPSKFRGEILGGWVGGKAKLVPEPEANRMMLMINRRYGLSGRMIVLFEKLAGRKMVVFAVQPDSNDIGK